MIFHSPIDNVVGIDNAARLYETARHPKNFVALDGADHLLTERRDAQFVAQMTATWASRYLATTADSDTETSDVPTNDDQVTVTLGQQHYLTRIQAGSHHLIADEPTHAGGGDMGPDPYRLLLASLGACTAITLRMYADRKQWPLDQVAVGLTHRRVHAQDCEQCEQQTGYTDQVNRTLQLQGSLDQQQRQRLQEIADKCPVHKTLSSGVTVKTELAETTDA
jgi:putative redox protein